MEAIRELIQKGELAQAESRLRERLTDAADDAVALNLYAVVLARRGDALGARSYFKRAIEAAPEEPSYLVNFGLLVAQQGDMLRASELLERASTLNPNWSHAHAQLGELALATGQTDAAEQRFRTALRANDADAQAHVGMAQILLGRGQVDEALKHAQHGILGQEEDARAQAVLGMVLLAKGHHAFARTALENAVRIEPANVRLRRIAARAQLSDGGVGAALTSMLFLTEFLPEDAPLLRALSESAIRAGGLSAPLIELLDRALPSFPDDSRLLHAAVEARVRSGRSADALALIAQHTNARTEASVWMHRLGLLARLGRTDEAFALTKEWREMAPQHADAHAEYATGAELRGETASARTAAEQALAIDPTHAKALTILCAHELRAGKPGPRLAALAQLEEKGLNASLQTTRNFLLGYGADRAGDSDTAVAHWLKLQTRLPTVRMPALTDPLGPPRELPLPLAPVNEARALVLMPYIPGSGAEALLRALAGGDSITVMTDRLGGGGRHDGLSADQRGQLEEPLTENHLRVFRRRYWRAFERLKIKAERLAIDVLPALEWAQYAALSGALSEARVLAYVRDPRDALLHWLAYGTTPSRPIIKAELAANYLLRQYQHLDRMRSSAGLAVSVIRAEDFDADRQGLRGRLGQALGVPPESLHLDSPNRVGLGGLPDRLENGRWRQYAAPLGKAFRLLAPAAKRFGYD
jgi:Flp pilus assembly protein TadD